jgi:hypothetical protein
MTIIKEETVVVPTSSNDSGMAVVLALILIALGAVGYMVYINNFAAFSPQPSSTTYIERTNTSNTVTPAPVAPAATPAPAAPAPEASAPAAPAPAAPAPEAPAAE